MFTLFYDMHSGGGLKEGTYQFIVIEAPQEEAEVIFQNRFGHNPNRVSCTCCGSDYSIDTGESLADLYHIKKSYERDYIDVEGDYLLIRAHEIKPEERTGELREQGYVWVD